MLILNYDWQKNAEKKWKCTGAVDFIKSGAPN